MKTNLSLFNSHEIDSNFNDSILINKTQYQPDIDISINTDISSNKIIEKKHYSTSLKESRIIAKTLSLNYNYKKFNTLHKIQYKSFHHPEHKFNDLMNILSNKDFLFHCLGTISKKEGILTPGIDSMTIDQASLSTIDKISTDLKNGTFKFLPIKRIFIPKTPSDKNLNLIATNLSKKNLLTKDKIKELKIRPLGICSFKDKIVQEGIRTILHSIYEPEFSKLNCNFGFRPTYGVHDAIHDLTTKSKVMSFAIEADISGAFDNINFNIMESILNKKISDQRFIKLIIYSLKCGIYYAGKYSSTFVGTTQGSSCSPILYNIYFHEFDIFIHTKIQELIQNKNLLEQRVNRPINRLYNQISKKKTLLKYKSIISNLKKSFNLYGKNSSQFLNSYNLFLSTKSKFNQLDKIQKTISSFNKNRQTLRFHYIRYADDWLFLCNGTLDFAKELKLIFTQWIDQNLKLELHPTKTKITNLENHQSIHFLGFQLRYANAKRIQQIGIKTIIKNNLINKTKHITIYKTPNSPIFKQRTTNPTLIAAWDRKRILTRLSSLGFISNRYGIYRGKRKTSWTILEAPEIIEKYNYIIRGYVDFYCPITYYPNDIHYLFYLLQYSCLHTLANKFNCSLKSIIKKYSKYPNISYEIVKEIKDLNNQNSTTILKKNIKLFSWLDIKKMMHTRIKSFRNRIKSKLTLGMEKHPDYIPNIKINWRTKYKLETKRCPICGCSNKIEYHHIKHIRIGKISGFLQILKNLNRKQIPCCSSCHDKIHNGTYDSLNISDLYDERLIIL